AAPEADEGVIARLCDDPFEVRGPGPRAGGIGRRAGDAEELERAVDGAAAEDARRLRRRAALLRWRRVGDEARGGGAVPGEERRGGRELHNASRIPDRRAEKWGIPAAATGFRW